MEIVQELRDRGIDISLTGNQLKIIPKDKVTPEVLTKIKANKDRILKELQATVFYCWWLRETVERCNHPCYQWHETGSVSCPNFKQYMKSIKRW